MTYLLTATVMRIRYCDAIIYPFALGPKHISPAALRGDGGAHCGINDVGMAGVERCGYAVTLYGVTQEPLSMSWALTPSSRWCTRPCSRGNDVRCHSLLPLLGHELLPVRLHGVEGEGEAAVGAGEHHVVDHLHSTATHFAQSMFQCLSQTEHLSATASQD